MLIKNIKIKPSFFVVAAFSFILKLDKYFIVMLALLTLHELCHIFTAALWGLKTRGVTVTALGAAADIDALERLHITKRILIAAAGPLFNLGLCPFCTTPLRQINLAIALFNLLPLYPMDGGKIFHYISAYFMGVLRGNLLAVKLSITLSICIMAAGTVQLALYPPNLSLLCLGLYFYRLNRSNTTNLTYNFYKTIVNKRDNKIMPVRSISTSAKMDIKAVLYRMGWDYYTIVYIRRNNAIIAVNEDAVLQYITKNGLKGNMSSFISEKT